MLVTLSGMVMLVSPMQLLKALDEMVVAPSPITTDFNDVGI